MDIEIIFQFLGYILCIAASILAMTKKELKPGILLLIGFSLNLFFLSYIQIMGMPDIDSSCYADDKYYQCLPLYYKILVHSAQGGYYLIAIGIFLLLAKKNDSNGNQ